MASTPIVRYLSQTEAISCPYGSTRRVLSGEQEGIANIHVITVAQGNPHYHKGYDEVYFVLDGYGWIKVDGERYSLEPGTVVSIPRGVVHSLKAEGDSPLQFVIFGVPALKTDSPDFTPLKP